MSSTDNGNAEWAVPAPEPAPQAPVAEQPMPAAPPMPASAPAPFEPHAAPPLPGWQPSAGQGFAPVPQPPQALGSPTPLTYRSWQPGVVALRPLPFGEFLTVPFKAMRFNKAVLIGGPLLAFTLTGLATSAAVWLAFTDDRLKLTSLDNSLTGVRPETVIVSVIAVVLAILSDLLASALVYPGVAQAVMGKRLGLGEAIRTITPRLGSMFGFSVLVGTTATILGGLSFLPYLTMLSSDPGTMLVGQSFGQLTTNAFSYGWSLLVTPLVITARGIIMLERKGVFAAIKRAFSLIKGRYWWTVLVQLVTQLVAGFVAVAFIIVVFILGGVGFALLTDQSAVGIAMIVLAVLTYIATLVVVQYTYAGTVGALIYLDLRFRKEGLAMDLARAAEAQHTEPGHTIG